MTSQADAIKANVAMEEVIRRMWEGTGLVLDGYWLEVAKIHLGLAFMAADRAIANKGRPTLASDELKGAADGTDAEA